MATLISEETLDRMFKDEREKEHYRQSGRCYSCDADVEITINKTSRGYGFKGGVFYESDTSPFLIQCERCYRNNGNSNRARS